MIDSDIQTSELHFTDEQHNRLTIDTQEALKARLLTVAKERATHDGSVPECSIVHEYYYDELAGFMSSYPSIYIDLILIKLDYCQLN